MLGFVCVLAIRTFRNLVCERVDIGTDVIRQRLAVQRVLS
jgi:hypothetical protein